MLSQSTPLLWLKPATQLNAIATAGIESEFLDVTSQLDTRHTFKSGDDEVEEYHITNSSSSIVDTHLLIIVNGLPDGVCMKKASGHTSKGAPYLRVFLPNGVLNPSETIKSKLIFEREHHTGSLTYTLSFLSGQGNP